MFGLYAAGIVSALGVSFVIKRFFWRDDATAALHAGTARLQAAAARAASRSASDTRAKMFLQARRHHHLLDDGADLVPGVASRGRPRAPTDRRSTTASPPSSARRCEPLIAPIGFNWQINVALIPGMAAREVAVGALGTVYAIEGGKEAAEQIGQVLAGKWSLATALSLLAWYVFAPQCASTLAVIRRETGSWKWMAVTFGYMLALAYAAALVTYQIARALGAG